ENVIYDLVNDDSENGIYDPKNDYENEIYNPGENEIYVVHSNEATTGAAKAITIEIKKRRKTK
ncbi:3423_t:CDS:2, partial [Funneliformis geosporum]